MPPSSKKRITSCSRSIASQSAGCQRLTRRQPSQACRVAPLAIIAARIAVVGLRIAPSPGSPTQVSE
jgi:hypothetical protein